MLLASVPPLAEIRLKGFDGSSWFMPVAASGTPRDNFEKLHRETRAIIGDPEMWAELSRLGLQPAQSPPQGELSRFVAAEIQR